MIFTLHVLNLLLVYTGGFLVFQLIEVVRGGKKIDVNIEKAVMASGFLLLSSVGLFLIVRDALQLSGMR